MTIYADTYKSKNFKKLVKDFILNKIEYEEIDTEIRNRFESCTRFHKRINDNQKELCFKRYFWRVEDFIRLWIKDYYRRNKDEENLLEVLVEDVYQRFNKEYKRLYRHYY